MSKEVLVKAENVSKKFCRSLKRSLWYGIQDVANDLRGHQGDYDELRKNEFWAVNNISFELQRGECLGLIGPNGAGKSSLLKMLNGLIKPDRGRITMRGRVGGLIELGAGFNPILTARENIYVNASVLGFSKKVIDQKFDDIVDFAEIEEFIDTPVQNFSSGMKVRLGFAVAAQMEPDVLLIDEVLAVGDVGFVAKCINRIGELMQSSAVIFISHSMPSVSRICSKIVTLNRGQIFYQGRDTAKGIESFFSLFNQSNSVETFRSSHASIDAVEIDTGGNRNITEVKHNDEIRLRIHCQIHSSVTMYCVNVLISDQNQNAIIFSSSHYSGKVLENQENGNALVVNLGKLNLNAGMYNVDVSVTDAENVAVLAKTQSIKQFKVISEFVGYAPIQIRGEWQGP